MFFLRVAGVEYVNDQAVNETLRPSTEVGVSYWPDEILSMEDTPTVAAFSIRAQFNEDAVYSIYTTTFVIGILIIGEYISPPQKTSTSKKISKKSIHSHVCVSFFVLLRMNASSCSFPMPFHRYDCFQQRQFTHC